MFINNVNINNFGAELVEKKIRTAEVKINYEWLDKSYTPIFLSKSNKFIIIECKIIIKAETKQNLEEKVSHFLKKVEVCNIKFSDLDFYFDVFLENKINDYFGVDERDGKEVESIYVNFLSGYKYKNEVVERIHRVASKTINVSGNLETPAVLEVVPSIDLIDLTINGLDEDSITLKNLKANKKLIVNGEDGTVTVDGVNKYEDTDMWEFPNLKPGRNTIEVNKSSCDITIKYKPRFI